MRIVGALAVLLWASPVEAFRPVGYRAVSGRSFVRPPAAHKRAASPIFMSASEGEYIRPGHDALRGMSETPSKYLATGISFEKITGPITPSSVGMAGEDGPENVKLPGPAAKPAGVQKWMPRTFRTALTALLALTPLWSLQSSVDAAGSGGRVGGSGFRSGELDDSFGDCYQACSLSNLVLFEVWGIIS
jgi:hypothetical protein